MGFMAAVSTRPLGDEAVVDVDADDTADDGPVAGRAVVIGQRNDMEQPAFERDRAFGDARRLDQAARRPW